MKLHLLLLLSAVITIIIAATATSLEIKIDRANANGAGFVYAFKSSTSTSSSSSSSSWVPLCADGFTNDLGGQLCAIAGLAIKTGETMYYSKTSQITDGSMSSNTATGLTCSGASTSSGQFPYNFGNCTATFGTACPSRQGVQLKCLSPGAETQNAGGGVFVGSVGKNAPSSSSSSSSASQLYFLRKDSNGHAQLRLAFTSQWHGVCSQYFDSETATAVCQSLAYSVTWASWSKSTASGSANIGFSNMSCGIHSGAASSAGTVLLNGCSMTASTSSCPVGYAATSVNCLAQKNGINVGGGWMMRLHAPGNIFQVILPGSVDGSPFGTACNFKYATNKMTSDALCYIAGFRLGAQNSSMRSDSKDAAKTSDAPILVANVSCPSHSPSSLGYCTVVKHPSDPGCNSDTTSNHNHDLVLNCNVRGNMTAAVIAGGGGAGGHTSIVRVPGKSPVNVVMIVCIVLGIVLVLGMFATWYCYRERAARDALAEVNTNADGFVRHRNFGGNATASPQAHAELMMSVGS